MARLLLPSLEREIRRDLTERAQDHAIAVFARNLRSLLLHPAQPPYPPYPPYPPPGQPNPDAGRPPETADDDVSRSNPPAHG